ncbi:MAG: glutamate--tRNA ligase [Clostridia bacterium]|nr:glutamate--tRNA ligase [Clostridia bacterium]
MENLTMEQILFPNIDKTPADYEAMYPPRELPEGAKVTRFAPSPTGFLHFGSLFAAFIAAKTAGKDGVFYLRIEDTDKKREVENAVEGIVNGLKDFGIIPDEGAISDDAEIGAYGPYTQSRRTHIYKAFVKDLVAKGLAYPCFMTEEEIAGVRAMQEEQKVLPGIYGKYAKYRDITADEAKKRIDAGEEYVVRLKSPGKPDGRIKFKDEVKGKIEIQENILDIVLLKKDGTPTYHFAHAIDDHLMRTTHVTRGDEWLSSVPIHLQLFYVLGFKAPKYAHISPIMKEDAETHGKRKLSKRKDPEAAVSFYAEAGYPAGAVNEYLMTIANSNYEDWKRANKTETIDKFPFALNKTSKAGALFDIVKLHDISKTYISTLDTDTVYKAVTKWANEYDDELYRLIAEDADYAHRIFSIERGSKKPRKDIGKWSEVKDYISYFYDDLFDGKREIAENIAAEDAIEILTRYSKLYDPAGAPEDWFPQVQELAAELGFARSPKDYRNEPEKYKGHAGDVAGVIRAAVTGRLNTPDLFTIMQVLGAGKVQERITEAINILKG